MLRVSLAVPVPHNDARLRSHLSQSVSLRQAPRGNSSARDDSLNNDDIFSLALLHPLFQVLRFLGATLQSPLPHGSLASGFVAFQAKPLPSLQPSLPRLPPNTPIHHRNPAD